MRRLSPRLAVVGLALIGLMLGATPALAQSGNATDAAKTVFDQVTRQVVRDWYEQQMGRTGARSDEETNGRTRERAKSEDDNGDREGERTERKRHDREREGERGGGKGHGKKGKHGRGNGLPPGLAKRDQLPPGLLKRGEQLPPGLAKRDLPAGLDAKLEPTPQGTERKVVGNDVVLIDTATNVILDTIENVIRGNRK